MTLSSVYALTSRSSRDPEPWGQALTVSGGVHLLGVLAVLWLGGHQKVGPRVVLTEVRFIEKTPTAVVAETRTNSSATKEVVAPTVFPEVPRGTGRTGEVNMPGPRQGVATHSEMTEQVPLSSPQGTPRGQALVTGPLRGPIVPSSEWGLLGHQKGRLAPLAGRTTGPTGKGLKNMISGESSALTETRIALSVEEISALKKKETSLGVPLIVQSVGQAREAKKLSVKGGAASHRLAYESLKSNPLERPSWGQQKGPFSLEGPLKYRKIVKMVLPAYPRWAEEQGVEATASFRLWVDPKGRVKDNFYVEKTSGYRELDTLAKESLMKFIFVALPPDQPQEDEWGVATFRFELTK